MNKLSNNRIMTIVNINSVSLIISKIGITIHFYPILPYLMLYYIPKFRN